MAGKKLYAVRDAKGRFKDIQTYERAHHADLKERARRNPDLARGTGIPRGVQIGGAGGLGLVLGVVLALVFAVDPTALLQSGIDTPPPAGRTRRRDEFRNRS